MDMTLHLVSFDGTKYEPKFVKDYLKFEETQWKHFTCHREHLKRLLDNYDLICQDARLRQVNIDYMGFEIVSYHQDTFESMGSAKLVLSADKVSIYSGQDFRQTFQKSDIVKAIKILEVLRP